jgi:hypothetical protein
MPDVFPKPIRYSRENSPGWKIKDWETANKLLSYLNTDGMSFACFQKPDGSYVQCAGSKARLTAEARIYDSPGRYRHFVIGRGELTGESEKIQTTDYEIEVDASQVLQMRHVRLVFRPWLEGGTFPGQFQMTDVTERFSQAPSVASE